MYLGMSPSRKAGRRCAIHEDHESEEEQNQQICLQFEVDASAARTAYVLIDLDYTLCHEPHDKANNDKVARWESRDHCMEVCRPECE